MRAPRVLDGFSGAGGSGRGYQMAGCEIVGVDVIDQPHYPGRFIRADFLKLSVDFLREFDLIHCSPPCQRYTSLRHAPGRHRDADLIGPTRKLLIASGVDYVIENVVGAPLVNPTVLCGSMFGLATPDGAELRRHRLVETSFSCSALACCHKPGAAVIGVYGGHARCRRRPAGQDHQPLSDFTAYDARYAMGVTWLVTNDELSQMVPPAFSEFVARQWLAGRQRDSEPPILATADDGPATAERGADFNHRSVT